MELWRLKNTDTRIVFPICDADGDPTTGATGLDSEYALFNSADHGGAAPSFGDCTHESAEIGTSGIYYLDISAAEINADYSIIQIKTSLAGCKTQIILIKTFVSTDLFMAAIADAVSDEATSGHATGGTIGKELSDINGHITADYGSTEKACVDLLDDAAGGLADIHTDVGTAISDITDVHGHANTIDGHITADYGSTEKANVNHITADYGSTEQGAIDLLDDEEGGLGDLDTDIDDIQTMLTDIHNTDLPAVKTVMDASKVVVDAVKVVTDNLATMYETDGEVKRFTTNALEKAPIGSTPPTPDAIANAICDEALSGHLTIGTVGDALDFTMKRMGGGQKLDSDNKQLVCYDKDNVTELCRFDTFDVNGDACDPTVTSVCDKRRHNP